MRLGEFRLELVDGGTERVAGEAIFGVIPEALWDRRFPPDAAGRVLLSRRGLLVRSAGFTALVAGFPGRYDLGRTPAHDVDALVLSRSGGPDPDAAMASAHPRAGVYLPDSLGEAEREIRPGMTLFPLPGGAAAGGLGVRLDSDGRTAAYLADALPTAAHVPTAWLVAGDAYPVDLVQGKKRLVDRAVRERWLCVFWRDPDVAWGTIVESARGVRRVHGVARDREEY
ncbi:MAG TPA: hypothetical protein VMH79_01195 [Thermoanaerobaculia bacterium]|nr:hypothetical protein [Thermoanaerobaculia bacterium]